MKKLFGLSLFVCSLFLAVPGCSGGGEASSMIENADQSAIEAYEAAIAAEEEMMNEDPPEDLE